MKKQPTTFTRSADNEVKVRELLVNLTDALGYDHENTAHLNNFNVALWGILDLIGRIEKAEYQKGYDDAQEDGRQERGE